MSENHASPRPTPQPFCAVYAPLLPLLHTDGLTAEEQVSVEAHLADCAWCQDQLATFDVVDAALRRHYESSPAVAASRAGSHSRVRPALTLEDIMKADQQERTTATRQAPAPRTPPLARNKTLTALGAIAAVLVLAVLAASLFNFLGSRATRPVVNPTSTATVSPELRPYFAVLNTYYRPLGQDMSVDDSWEFGACYQGTCSRLTEQRPVEVQIASEAQAFLDHMTVAPPAQLQTDDTYLKQAAKVTISLYAKRIALIDAQDGQGFKATVDEAIANRDQYCGPIADINALLPSSARLPVSGIACQYTFPTPTP